MAHKQADPAAGNVTLLFTNLYGFYMSVMFFLHSAVARRSYVRLGRQLLGYPEVDNVLDELDIITVHTGSAASSMTSMSPSINNSRNPSVASGSIISLTEINPVIRSSLTIDHIPERLSGLNCVEKERVDLYY